jgi:hypothetical protein
MCRNSLVRVNVDRAIYSLRVLGPEQLRVAEFAAAAAVVADMAMSWLQHALYLNVVKIYPKNQ